MTAALEALTPAELQELDELLAGEIVGSFREFVGTAKPDYQWYRHCAQLADVLQRVAEGEITRLIVQMPPRHGKSETVTRLFSAYYLRRFPNRWVGVNTYASDLSYLMSRAAKGYYQGRTEEHDLSVEAVKHWETPFGGGLWAAGVGGPITGKGFHLGIVDDPIKNAEEANSPVIRKKQQEWWDSTFFSRQEPNAAIVVITTRWHDQDLVGYLLSKEESEPERWHVVDMAALKDGTPEYAKTCTVELDAREDGEALCPERYSAEKLNAMKRQMGDYFFSALYQQRPRPREGGMFKREWFEIVEALPADLTFCRGWDQAATHDGGDYTSGTKIGKSRDGTYYVTDVKRGQWRPGDRDKVIKQTASTDGKQCRIQGEQEPGAAGKTCAESFVKMLDGYPVSTTPASGDKVLGATPFASQAEVGNVKLLKGPWNEQYLDEMCAFPTGHHDDDVDSSSLSYNKLAGGWTIPTVSPVALGEPSKWLR